MRRPAEPAPGEIAAAISNALTSESSAPAGVVAPAASVSPPEARDALPVAGDPGLKSEVDALAALARFLCRTTHWQVTQYGPRHVKAPLYLRQLEAHISGGGPRIGLAPITPGTSTTRAALIDLVSTCNN